VLAFAIYFVIARVFFKTKAADAMVGSAASGYLNANNIGLPVASYVLGDPKYVAPVILFQLLVLAPITLGVLDSLDGGRVSVKSILTQPLRNPIIIASIAGAVVAATGITIPAPVMAPLQIIGGAAIPLMLIAFGMSLRGQRPFQAGAERREIATASAIKLVVMPLMAWAIAYYFFGLTGQALYVSVVLAALPTAQNIYNFAVRYDRGVVVARDTILLTTVLAIPVLLVVALLLS
jgi:predicted permease